MNLAEVINTADGKPETVVHLECTGEFEALGQATEVKQTEELVQGDSPDGGVEHYEELVQGDNSDEGVEHYEELV